MHQKKSKINKVAILINTEVVDWLKNDWISLETPSLKVSIYKASENGFRHYFSHCLMFCLKNK